MIRPILDEIKKELDKQYPGYSNLFNPPASGEQIAAYENLTGLEMPHDWKELYTIHNGQQQGEKYGLAFIFSLPFLTIEESMRQWKVLNEQLGDTSMFDHKSHSVPADHIREQYVNKGWIPISKDSGGNYVGIDLNPDVKGTRGQVINFGRDEETKYVIASGLEAYFNYMLALIRENRLSILAQDDDDADEEEDDDGNILPLPKVYRFAIDGSVIWHFLDWLKVLDLPGKPVLTGADKDYHSWLDKAPDSWKALVDAICNAGGIGFVPPARVIRFYPRDLPVDNLQYIHYFSNAREVILSGAKLKDVLELEALPLIKILYLSNSTVQDLSVLKTLKRLQYLSLRKLDVSDLTPLEELPLTRLDLAQTSVTDLESVSKISTLKELDISDTKISSVEALAGLESLASLDICGTSIKDLSFLDRLKALRELKIYGLDIADDGPLLRAKNITRITCSFALFKALKKGGIHEVHFTIQNMAEEEEEEWKKLLWKDS
jgi:internalin A